MYPPLNQNKDKQNKGNTLDLENISDSKLKQVLDYQRFIMIISAVMAIVFVIFGLLAVFWFPQLVITANGIKVKDTIEISNISIVGGMVIIILAIVSFAFIPESVMAQD